MPNLFLKVAIINGFIVVVLGAFGAHALKDLVPESALTTWQTAVQYHMFHVIVLLALGLLVKFAGMSKALFYSGVCFVLGIIMFSGSLYLLTLLQLSWLGMITPLGGLCFLLGWGMLLKAVMSYKE